MVFEESKKNCASLENNSCNSTIDMSYKVPVVHQFSSTNLPSKFKREDWNNLHLLDNSDYSCIPLKMVLFENQICKSMPFRSKVHCQELKDSCTEGSSFEWPGIEEVMLSYSRYAKDLHYILQ
ncbi:hypothetical protein NQ317_012309 [Molorchus minor]|uniref:Uncharacterized protein n=1 Tax=Molorchus minor TaxID=1323400 RepID=A0ABQ9IUF4_9CUCU|nr:hypothetical protein NQ317_012309 [Molorchus minor]